MLLSQSWFPRLNPVRFCPFFLETTGANHINRLDDWRRHSFAVKRAQRNIEFINPHDMAQICLTDKSIRAPLMKSQKANFYIDTSA